MKISLAKFSRLVNTGNIDDLNLSIYYISPFALTPYPLNVAELIRTNEIKVIVNGNDLQKHIDLLRQIEKVSLLPIANKSHGVEARVYYVFETKNGKKILDVVMWGTGGDEYSIFLNGIEIKNNDIFYDIILPFLPERAASELEPYKSSWSKRS